MRRFRSPAVVIATLLCGALTVRASARLRGWLGIGVKIHVFNAQTFLHVQNVVARGPADSAGVRPLDVIVAINDRDVAFKSDLAFLDFLRTIKAGDHVRLKIRRADRTMSFAIVAAELVGERKKAWDLGYEVARRQSAAASERHP